MREEGRTGSKHFVKICFTNAAAPLGADRDYGVLGVHQSWQESARSLGQLLLCSLSLMSSPPNSPRSPCISGLVEGGGEETVSGGGVVGHPDPPLPYFHE